MAVITSSSIIDAGSLGRLPTKEGAKIGLSSCIAVLCVCLQKLQSVRKSVARRCNKTIVHSTCDNK